MTMKAGETKRGEVYVGTEDNRRIQRICDLVKLAVTVPESDRIAGTGPPCGFPLAWMRWGLSPGDCLKGWLCFTTRCREMPGLPFEDRD